MAGDISLLFDVLGGESISSGSGKAISDQINGIVNAINSTPLKIKFIPDENSLNGLKSGIESILKGIGNLSGDLKLDPINSDNIVNSLKNIESYFLTFLSTLGKNIPELKEQLNNIFNSIPESGAAGSIKEISNAIIELQNSVELLGSSFEGLKSGGGAESALDSYKQRAVQIMTVFGELANVIQDKSSTQQQQNVIFTELTRLEKTLPGITDAFNKYNAAKVGAQIGRQDIVGIQAITSEYQKYADAVIAVFQRINSQHGFNLPIPDTSKIESVKDSVVQYNEAIENSTNIQAETSEGIGVSEYATKMQNMCDEVTGRLTSLKDIIEKTFDFSEYPKDAGQVIVRINALIEKAKELNSAMTNAMSASNRDAGGQSSGWIIGDKNLDTARQKIDNLISTVNKTAQSKGLSNINVSIGGTNYNANQALSDLSNQLTEYRAKTLSANTTQLDFNNALDKYKTALKAVTIAINAKHEEDVRNNKDQREAIVNSTKVNKAIASNSKLYAKATEAIQKYTAARNGKSSEYYKDLEDTAAALKTLGERYASGAIQEREFIERSAELRASMEKDIAMIKQNGEAHLSLGDSVKKAVKQFSEYFTVAK